MKWALSRILFAVLLLGALWLVLGWRDNVQKSQVPAVNDEPKTDIETIVVAHTYKNSTHTLTGAILVPNPCHDLKTEAIVAESFPEQVTVNFTVTPPSPDRICIQVIDSKQFKVEFQASENPVIRAKLNDKPVSLVIEDQSGTLKPIELLK